jgi:hypothetical protein
VGKKAPAAILYSVRRENESAFAFGEIQRTEAKQTVKAIGRGRFVAREIFAVFMRKKGI